MLSRPMRSFAAAAVALASVPTSQAQVVQPQQLATRPGERLMAVEFAPGVTDQLYVAERSGLILRFTQGQFAATPFLDITDRVGIVGEGGLLGLAFDPEFQMNGYVYVYYTTPSTNGDTVVSRFEALPGSAEFADPNSETILLGPIAQESQIHKSGDLEFGPDGMLYISSGDGDVGIQPPLNSSQDLSDPRGAILRMDVRAPFPHVPLDNPFVGVAGAEPLIYGYGLRNPFRFDIDPVTGDLFTGDVGAGAFEEVNLIPANDAGRNFGWRCREGTQCTQAGNCTCPSSEFVDPVAFVLHSPTSPICAIAGGVFLSGSSIPSLDGTYLFNDFCSGMLFAVEDPAGAANLVDLSADFVRDDGQPIRFAVDFEQAPNGDVYFVTLTPAALWRLDAAGGFDSYCSASPNSSGAPAAIRASGSPSIAAGSLRLEVTDLPPNAFGLFLMSRSAGLIPLPGGSQGTLCIDQPIYRWSFAGNDSGPSGEVSRTSDLSDLPPMVDIQPGDTWYFQYWTRDSNPGPTSNTSNGAIVHFVQ